MQVSGWLRGADGLLELRRGQHGPEYRAAGLQYPPSAEVSEQHRVVPDPVDNSGHGANSRQVITSNARSAAVRGPSRPGVVFQFVIADMVQRLDDRRAG